MAGALRNRRRRIGQEMPSFAQERPRAMRVSRDGCRSGQDQTRDGPGTGNCAQRSADTLDACSGDGRGGSPITCPRPVPPFNSSETDMTSIALVTGSSRGLGRNTALGIARRGGDVIVTWRTGEAEAQRVVEEIRSLGRPAVALPLDIADVDMFADFAGRLRQALKD